MMATVFDYIIVAVKDSHGYIWSEPVAEMSDDVQVYGIRDANDNLLHFESEAYHLRKWCADNGLIYHSEEARYTVSI